MSKYSWDITYLVNLKDDFTSKLNNSTTVEDKNKYQDVIEQIDILLYISLMSSGEVIDSKVRCQSLLDEYRNQVRVDDSSYLFDELVSDTLPLFNQFEPLIGYRFKKRIKLDECIDILGNIINNVFGEEHYKIYKEYILDRKNVIQVSNLVEGASITTINVDGLDNHFMLLPNKHNFDLFSFLVHEVGHLFRLKNNDTSPLLDDKLFEFESYFYQIKILEYCIENNIYAREALVSLINIFKDIEKVAILFDNANRFNLQNHFNISQFKELCGKINLYDKTNLRNTKDLLEYLSYVYSRNILNYIYSILAVLEVKDREDGMDIYNHIVTNIGKISSDEYVYEIFDDPITFNGLEKYKKYRNKLLSLGNKGLI